MPSESTALALRVGRAHDPPSELSSPRGRYSAHQAIAVGEFSSVHLGVFLGKEGFRHTVAVKRLLPDKANEPAAVAGLIYEACIVAQIHHPNVASVLDLGETKDGPFVVMEYVLGDTVAGLLKAGGRCPVPIAVAIVTDALRGLHAAHVAHDFGGEALEIVHRNICPENILVGVDGAAHVIDFGSALSALDSSTLPTMARRWPQRDEFTSPEQLMAWPVDARADLFAVAVVLWELIVGTRPFRNHGARQAFLRRPTRTMPPASAFNVEVSAELEAVIERALNWSPRRRFETAEQFAEELEAAVSPATRAEVAAYVEEVALAKVAIERAWLSAIQAPYGRINTPSAPRRTLESERTPRVPRRKPYLQVASMSRRATAQAARLRRMWWVWRWRLPISRYGSGVLAGLTLACLLFAARAHRLSRQPAQPPEPMATPALPPPVSHRIAMPPRAPAPASVPIEQPSFATDQRDPFRPKASIPKSTALSNADPTACGPPFTVDDSGVRRINPSCP
jgi:serine/threonine protein kinase